MMERHTPPELHPKSGYLRDKVKDRKSFEELNKGQPTLHRVGGRLRLTERESLDNLLS